MLQVLQERWDPTFSEHSYGFRPGRSAHQAVAQAQRYIADGYNVVVDLDLEKFFDRVNHDSLMARVAARVSDKRVLKLIRAFLNAGVMEDGLVRPVDEGTPQGGPLSPILSNLVLDDLDKELARRGHRFCRYADDCNIYVRSRRAGERVMASVSRFLTNKLRLKVNEAKSAVARPEERKFLGFSISNDGSERRIAPKALDKFKERIRDMTRRTRGFSLQQLIKELKPYIVGWRGYFGFCQTPRSPHKPRSVDPSKIAFVSLAAMANQAKPLRGVTPSRRSKVPSGGRGWFTNRALAHVRTPGGPTSPTQRLFRVARSSPNLCARPSLTRSNRRGTGPVCPVVWEGWRREASPYPDLGRKARLHESPGEGPECGPKPPFHCKHETGFATTKMEELAAIAHCPFREATERAAQFRRQLMLPVRPFPRLARCDRGYWSTALHSGTTSNGAPWVAPKATGALPESADVAYRPHFRSSRKFRTPIKAARKSSG